MDIVERHRPAAALVGAALLLVLIGGVLWWPFTIDDAYIFARVAANLVAGDGPVFNLGQRLEVQSSPLWVGLLALGAGLGADPVTVAKALGLACAPALIALLAFALLRARCHPLIAAAAALWLASNPDLWVYAPSGMETIAYALAVTALAVAPDLKLAPRGERVLLAAGILAVSALRPEGFIVAAAVSVAASWRRDRATVVAIGIGWAMVAALFVGRLAYHGALFPHAFLAKPSPLREAAPEGWLAVAAAAANQFYHLRSHLNEMGGVAAVALAAIALIAGGGRRAVAALAACLGGIVFLLYAPPDWMFGDRFALPYVPAMVYLAALGVDALRERLPMRPVAFEGTMVATVLLGVVLNAVAGARYRVEYRAGDLNPALNAGLYVDAGRWLRVHGSRGDRVLAYEVGGIGYGSGFEIIDHEGLVTREVAEIFAHARGYGVVRSGQDDASMRAVVEACVARRPTWFMVRSAAATARNLALGRPVPPTAALENIQRALLTSLGDSMVLAAMVPLAPRGGYAREYYLILHRAGP